MPYSTGWIIACVVSALLLAGCGIPEDRTTPFHEAATAACAERGGIREFEGSTRDTVLCADGTVQDVKGW